MVKLFALFNQQDATGVMSKVHSNDRDRDFDEMFAVLENERLEQMYTLVIRTIKEVLSHARKVLEVDGEVVLTPVDMSAIVESVVRLGESEPYGVQGGNLVVLFSPPGCPTIRVGSFPLDPTRVATFQLRLVLHPQVGPRAKLANLLRKLGGKREKVVMEKFELTKKKLYRSDSTGSFS